MTTAEILLVVFPVILFAIGQGVEIYWMARRQDLDENERIAIEKWKKEHGL
jgi:hypothetical protein